MSNGFYNKVQLSRLYFNRIKHHWRTTKWSRDLAEARVLENYLRRDRLSLTKL